MFVLDIIIRIIANGPRKFFFSKKFTIFDLMTLLTFTLELVLLKYNSKDSNSVRYFGTISKFIQILRILKIVKNVNFLKKLFTTLKFVLPETINLAILLFVVLLIFSIIGVDLFGYLKPQNNVGNRNIHFRNVFYAILTLIRGATGESWYLFYADCRRKTQPNFICFEIKNYNDLQLHGLLY